MELTKDTKLKDILKAHPWLVDAAVEIDPAFRALRSPLGKMLIARADIAEASSLTGIDTETIIEKIEELIQSREEQEEEQE